MRRRIRLTESDLRHIVCESVINILKEGYINEKHAPSGTRGRRKFVTTMDSNGRKQTTTYYNVPNPVKFNKYQKFKPAYKFQRVNARQVTDPNGENVDTILKDGTLERQSNVPMGDYILQNISSPEQWPVDAKTFTKKYEEDPEQQGVYKPKGGPMYASEPTKFNMVTKPPKWGGYSSYMKKGGRIMVDPNDRQDTYPNAEFGSGTGNDGTYKFYDQQAPYKPLSEL